MAVAAGRTLVSALSAAFNNHESDIKKSAIYSISPSGVVHLTFTRKVVTRR